MRIFLMLMLFVSSHFMNGADSNHVFFTTSFLRKYRITIGSLNLKLGTATLSPQGLTYSLNSTSSPKSATKQETIDFCEKVLSISSDVAVRLVDWKKEGLLAGNESLLNYVNSIPSTVPGGGE